MEKDVARNIEEQLSAFLDGELPQEELALLVRRLGRDESHRATLDRYALIGGALRNDSAAADAARLRRAIMASLGDDSDGLPEQDVEEESANGGQLRYFLAASMLVGVMAIFFAGNFQQAGVTGPAVAPTAAVTANVAPVVQEASVEVRERHQRELQRIKVNQERMRGYLISHGEHSRSLQGAMTDSRMYVQQASFSE